MSPPPLLWRQHPQLGNLFCRWQAVSTFGVQGEFMRTAPSLHLQGLTDVRFAFVLKDFRRLLNHQNVGIRGEAKNPPSVS